VTYVLAAYALTFLLIGLYVWSVYRRTRAIEQELAARALRRGGRGAVDGHR
jgi:heme exporter protein CcmD